MAFVNEYISEADYEKYDLRRICGMHNLSHPGDMHSRHWTIDRDIETFLISTWYHRESEFSGYGFFFKGTWFFFEGKSKQFNEDQELDSCWTLFLVKGLYPQVSSLPNESELIRCVRNAFSMYSGMGVLGQFKNRSATVEFIEE